MRKHSVVFKIIVGISALYLSMSRRALDLLADFNWFNFGMVVRVDFKIVSPLCDIFH